MAINNNEISIVNFACIDHIILCLLATRDKGKCIMCDFIGMAYLTKYKSSAADTAQ